MAKGRFVKKVVPETTNNITKGIVNQIISDGWSASRINTTGIYDPVIGDFRKSGARKGFSDVAACIRGMFVVIEVKNKSTGDRLKKQDQIEFIAEVKAAGGIAYIAETMAGFNQWYFNELPSLIELKICLMYRAIIKASE